MSRRKKGLEGIKELNQEIKELEQERDLRKKEWKQNSCKGNENAYYLSEINLNNLRIKETKVILDDCYQKLNFSLGNLFGYSFSRFIRGFGKLMNKTRKDLKKYSVELEKFKCKFYNNFCKPSIDSV